MPRLELEEDLRRGALAAVQGGVLPRNRPERTWGGNGSGETCPVCGQPIDAAEQELELEFVVADTPDAVREFHLHVPCYAAWEFARKTPSTG